MNHNQGPRWWPKLSAAENERYTVYVQRFPPPFLCLSENLARGVCYSRVTERFYMRPMLPQKSKYLLIQVDPPPFSSRLAEQYFLDYGFLSWEDWVGPNSRSCFVFIRIIDIFSFFFFSREGLLLSVSRSSGDEAWKLVTPLVSFARSARRLLFCVWCEVSHNIIGDRKRWKKIVYTVNSFLPLGKSTSTRDWF